MGPDIKSIIIQHAPTRLSVKSPADMFVWTDDAIKMATVLLVKQGGTTVVNCLYERSLFTDTVCIVLRLWW